MLKNIIEKYINSDSRNKISYLEKEITNNSILYSEFKRISNHNLSIRNNIYNIYYDIDSIICPVCQNQKVAWNEKDFCYRKTCSYKCSGKLLKTGKKEYKFPEIESKEQFISLVRQNKVKLTSITKTSYYEEVKNYRGETLQEKTFRWINELNDQILCDNKDCQNEVGFVNFSKGFRQFCSVKCSSSSDVKISKVKETCLEKYKVDNVSKRQLHIERYKSILSNFDIISYDSSSFVLFHHDCKNQIEITRRMIYDRNNMNTEICTHCNKIQSMQSGYELQLKQWLINLGINIDENNRKIIYPKELDLFLPDYNIAIEFNGLFWHSENYVGKNYHIDKTKLCEEKNIKLIHIWEDDWIYKNDIVKSIISNKLKINQSRVYARNCEVREVTDVKLVKDFLNKNHIQGYCKSQHKIGLFYNNELISLMTFGFRKTNSKKEFELIRFSNKKYYTVIGSASKLFSFFVNKYQPEFILSYADISLFDGSLYNSLGFKFIHRTEPNYYWVVDGIRYHRWVFNKKKLLESGGSSKKTEKEIMTDRGHFRVFSCGQDRYEFTK